MPFLPTHTWTKGLHDPWVDEQLYNGLDTMITLEGFQALRSLRPSPPEVYNFSIALQGPVLDMMSRGLLVDEYERQRMIADLTNRLTHLNTILQQYAHAVWDAPLNARSSKQLQDFFFTRMNLPEVWSFKKGEKKLSMDRDALEKLHIYHHAKPIINVILAIRDLSKQREVLVTEVEPDGRMRTSYNIAGTETARFSSSSNAFGTGCVLPTAEALTPTGWKEIQNIKDGDLIAQYDNGKITFVPCSVFKTEFEGNMLEFSGEQMQLTITPGHRVLHYGHDNSKLIEEFAQKASQRAQIYIPAGGSLEGGTLAYPPYLAMLMADFSKEEYGWRGAFKKERKIERFLELAQEFGLEYKELTISREGYRRFSVPGHLHLPKKWGEWVLDLSPTTAELLLEEARHWDAHDRGSGFIFYTADKAQAEWFATLAHIANRSATVRKQEQSANSYSTTTMWAVNVKNRNVFQVQRKHWKEVPYKGTVYCPTVPSSFWLVRENLKISVTGNTNLQNIARDLRHIFIADPGRKICGIDLEQAESREVAWLCWVLFGDPSYMDACLSGDLHTTVSRLGWPHLPWTGDIKKDRAIAEGPFYRWYTYRDMAKKLGHGCLTADHEVLTPNGWVSISACPDVILTWDLGPDGKPMSYFNSVSHWNAFPYSGTLHEFDGNSVSALMTSNHRVPYVADTRRPILRAKLAKDGPGHAMPLGGGWLGGDQIVPARLIAAFMSDGYQKGSSMEFHFHKERKKKRLRELCAKYGYELKETPEKMYVRGVLPKTPGSFMLLWTAECLHDFLDEYKHWDGHIGATSVSLHSSKLEHLRWLQTFGRILGIGGNINGPQTSGFGTEMRSLQQNNRQWASGKSVSHSKQKVSDVPVFCPTVPSSWFYVRRNGKVFVTGNSNYYGKPPTMARHAKIPTEAAAHFQTNYFGAFPGIPKYHTHVAGQLQTVMKLTTPFGRTRHFFGRPNDDTTLREAIAYSPQSATADRLNLALWRIWHRMGNRIRLLAQVHDALYFDFDENDNEAEIVSTALSLIDTPMHHAGRTLSVPGEAKTGWNWGDFNDDEKRGRINAGGLKKFKGEDKRKREAQPTLLERIM